MPRLKPLTETATARQFERILNALRVGPRTSEDLRAAGVFQVSARIHNLRGKGYPIHTALVNIYDRAGYGHRRVALYSLEEPPPGNSEAPDCANSRGPKGKQTNADDSAPAPRGAQEANGRGA